jgi:hypothetical protein
VATAVSATPRASPRLSTSLAAAAGAAGTARITYRTDVLDVGAVSGTGTLGFGAAPAGDWAATVPDDEGVPRGVRVLAVGAAAYAQPAGLPLPPGAAWVALPSAGAALTALLDRLRLVTDPVALLGLAGATPSVSGPDEVDGAPAVRHEVTVDVAAALDRAGATGSAAPGPATVRELERLRSAGVRSLRVTVWLGADGLPLRLASTTDGGSRLASDVTFAGWGLPTAPAAPAPGAVVPLEAALGGS